MSEPRGPRDERDARVPGDPRDSRELGEQFDKQERRLSVTAVLFVVIGFLVAGMTVIGVFALREPEQRRLADEREQIARSVENCRSDNETRTAVIELVRKIEGDPSDGTASIFPIPVPPGAGSDVVALIEYVNMAATSAPSDVPEQSATDLAKETLPRKDCLAP